MAGDAEESGIVSVATGFYLCLVCSKQLCRWMCTIGGDHHKCIIFELWHIAQGFS